MNRLACLALVSITACAGAEAYDDSWGSDEIPSGKADGLLDGAEQLDFDEVGTGFVEDEQMDIFAIDLKGGDKISATLTVTSGDLSPHFTLFFGGSSHVSSKTFDRETKRIVKTYELASTGRYFVAVRPFKNEGAGKYRFSIACTGGPCAGEPVVRTLSVDEQAECITKARRCSFAELPKFAGFVGPSRARSTFQSCLAASMTTDDGVECSSACDEVDDAKPLCESIIGALPFYADASPACLAELDECMGICHEAADGTTSDELFSTAESICWENGFNGTCDGYARGHKDCGGTYGDNSNAECHALCEATDGAWTDDLDLICVESCD